MIPDDTGLGVDSTPPSPGDAQLDYADEGWLVCHLCGRHWYGTASSWCPSNHHSD